MNATGAASQAMDCVHDAIEKAMAAPNHETIAAIGVSFSRPSILKAAPSCTLPISRVGSIFPCVARSNSATGFQFASITTPTPPGSPKLLGALARTQFSLLRHHRHRRGHGDHFEWTRLYGRTGTAAEGGHMTIDFRAPVRCGCGKHGCLKVWLRARRWRFARGIKLRSDGASGAACSPCPMVSSRTSALKWSSGVAIRRPMAKKSCRNG